MINKKTDIVVEKNANDFEVYEFDYSESPVTRVALFTKESDAVKFAQMKYLERITDYEYVILSNGEDTIHYDVNEMDSLDEMIEFLEEEDITKDTIERRRVSEQKIN